MSSKSPAGSQHHAAVAGLDIERDIELVRAFLNTRDAENGTEILSDADRWQQWCQERELGQAPELGPAREIRDRMRASIMDRAEPAITSGWPLRVELRDGVPTLVGEDPLGTVLASAVHVVHTGHWDRIKICPAHDCLEAFYDRSRNRSRTWCNMKVCGNRMKARSWRERHVPSWPAQ